MARLYHICPERDWQGSLAQGRHEPPSLALEGFVHCSLRGQLRGVADRFFRGQRALVLLEIDADRLGSEIRFENTDGGDERFPHVYGAIEVAAVVAAHPLAVDDDGRVSLPEEDR